MIKNKLSLKLLELRQKHNLTQQELCKTLSLSRASYSYFENGRRVPDINTLLLIAQYYNISLDELVTDSAPFSPQNSDEKKMYESGIALIHHLESKHIPIEAVMSLSKTDFDFLMTYKKLSKENQAEIAYIINYKIRKQSG